MSKYVIALGGNAIQKTSQAGNIADQFGNSSEACAEIVKVVQAGHVVALTHGNGPQVGNILRRSEIASTELFTLPLDTCVADSQGGMGYMLQQVMKNELQKVGLDNEVVTLITRCIVDPQDPAFGNPTKFIGSPITKEQAEVRHSRDGWILKEDVGRGWRRVVASPWPKEIIERKSIQTLMDAGIMVITVGGGGIPVMRKPSGELVGVEAVIDKDLASAELALEIKADKFIVLTGVEQVKINFKKPDEKSVARMTVAEAKKYMADGQFPAGSMGPKIQAAIFFLESGGTEVLITSTDKISASLKGETGTYITP